MLMNEKSCLIPLFLHKYKSLHCFNGNKSRVIIRDARGVTCNARLLLMFVTRHHTKHVLNYEFLIAAQIMYSVLAYENVIRL